MSDTAAEGIVLLQDDTGEKSIDTDSASGKPTVDPLIPSDEAIVGDFSINNQPTSISAAPVIDLTSPDVQPVTGAKKKIIVRSVKTLRKRK